MPNYHYYQQIGQEETWTALPVAARYHVETELRPNFITVLAVSKLVEDLPHDEKLRLTYAGPLYFDWDLKLKGEPTAAQVQDGEILVISKVNQFLDTLVEMGLDLQMCRLYATGGRGYHMEVPQAVFMDKVPKAGTMYLPAIYREIAQSLCVDTLDMTIYSAGRGRMWRVTNNKRSNGRFKVPVTVSEMRGMTPESCHYLTSGPRQSPPITAPELCIKLQILYARMQQKVDALMKTRGRSAPDPKMREKASGHSVQWMMAGLGIKEDAGFQKVATQLAIAAVASGLTEDQFVLECAGLIANHESDGDRYNTPGRRAEELRRMHRYMDGNLCYEFSVGAIKSLLTHSAPDLDGIAASKEDIKEVIEAAETEATDEQDEYDDVAKGVTMAKYGIYMSTEFGQKRICAISFANTCVLKSAESCQIVGYEADVLVNGVRAGRQTLETEVFAGLLQFNRFAAKYGHAFQGQDAQVRTVMMRFVEQSKKSGEVRYIVNREGLDLISIPGHENPALHEPFLIWADSRGVVAPVATANGLELAFAGFPDPRGVFRTDIGNAPALDEWILEPGNKEALKDCLQNLMTCQRPELLGKLIGWYTACFWKQLFQKVYDKFPLMHVNGSAGAGKSEMNTNIANLFYYRSEPKLTSPGSTVFSLGQFITASSSIPLVIDEYKPHEMAKDKHNQIKLMFRDSYNQHEMVRGGGNRESEDYRRLQYTQLAAPIVFIAEATEDEAAVMERVVLATVVRPPAAVGLKWLSRFNGFKRNKHFLGILGQHLAAQIVHETTLESFADEFDTMYAVAKDRFLVTESDLAGGISQDALQEKQHAKERSVFNHTVAKFGMAKFRGLVNSVVGKGLDSIMAELEDGIYERMSDLHAATTPEYVKVLQDMCAMSYLQKEKTDALRPKEEYAFSVQGGRAVIEIAVRTSYYKYRTYRRNSGQSALYGGYDAFAYALKDSPAYIKQGIGDALQQPGVFMFSQDELARLGVDMFQEK